MTMQYLNEITNCIFCGFLLNKQFYFCQNSKCLYIFKCYDYSIRIKACDNLYNNEVGNNCYDFYINNYTNILITKNNIEIFKDYYDYEFSIDQIKEYFLNKEESFKRNSIFT